jgi:hypothetical protein
MVIKHNSPSQVWFFLFVFVCSHYLSLVSVIFLQRLSVFAQWYNTHGTSLSVHVPRNLITICI